MTPIPDAQAGNEPRIIGTDVDTPKMLTLQAVTGLYFQALLACPNQLRTPETCESCTLSQKSECDLYGKMWDEFCDKKE